MATPNHGFLIWAWNLGQNRKLCGTYGAEMRHNISGRPTLTLRPLTLGNDAKPPGDSATAPHSSLDILSLIADLKNLEDFCHLGHTLPFTHATADAWALYVCFFYALKHHFLLGVWSFTWALSSVWNAPPLHSSQSFLLYLTIISGHFM